MERLRAFANPGLTPQEIFEHQDEKDKVSVSPKKSPLFIRRKAEYHTFKKSTELVI